MRIVAGQFRGRELAAPRSQAIRPTADRLRETVFNVLAHAYGDPVSGARIIDLFAGTGALGLEALSRGARYVLFVDEGAEARGLIRTNIDGLGLGGRTRLFRRDACRLGAAGPIEPFSLAFLDPPYRRGLAEKALGSLAQGGWLLPGSLAVIEEAAETRIEPPASFEALEERDHGDTRLTFLRYGNAAL
jgi:16S rRNA (guanine966-N2)-methyltransferase